MHLRTAADVFHRYLARGRDGSLVLYMVQLYPQYKQNSLQSDKAQCRSCCSCASVATYRYLATTLLFRSLASQFVNTCTCRFEPSLTRSAAKRVEPMTCSMHVRACMHPKWPVTGRFECNDQINSSTIKDHRPSKQEARSHSARGPPLSVDQTLSLHLTFTGRARLGVHARRLVTGTAKCRLGPSPPQAGG
eukprot:COSAG05_NODE_29_length_29038_cov_1237.466985_2_plen_191_part_00